MTDNHSSRDRTEARSPSPNVSARVALRPVTPADRDFLLDAYASARAEEMSLVPWTEDQKRTFVSTQFDAQQQHYQKLYPTAAHEIILWNDRRVGQLYLARLDAEVRIVDLLILPSERNNGIGTYLITRLQAEAKQGAKPLKVYVESFNPSIRLFERLGFSRGEVQGVHILMECPVATRV
jgi:RimJ/RimL family protein N-acetyltransferase